MKKIISAVLSAALLFSTAAALPASAESYGDGVNITVLGDSIASGTGLSDEEYNYGQIVADYLGGSVENYAVSGYDSAETLAQIRSFDSEQKAQLADSDIVIISTGANDMIKFAASSLLEFAEKNNLLMDGKTAADLPENPTLQSIKEFINMDALINFAGNFSNARSLNDRLTYIYQNITYTDANPNGANRTQVIAKQIIPNINEMVSEIKAANPDARIVLQTVYNPLQLQASYEEAVKAAYGNAYNTAYIQFKTLFQNITEKYAAQIKEVEGVEIADVLTDFSSTDENSQKYGWYFTKVQAGQENLDIHPTQAGHVAIATTIINTLGETREDGGLLSLAFNGLTNADSYPAYALNEYKKIAGTYCLGDVNADGSIDATDANLVLVQYAMLVTSQSPTISAEQMKACELNNDDTIDSSDASAILGYYAYSLTGGKGTSLKEYLMNK